MTAAKKTESKVSEAKKTTKTTKKTVKESTVEVKASQINACEVDSILKSEDMPIHLL